MRLAFFSPLPPVKSGIADYSAALLGPLQRLCEVETFSAPFPDFNPANFDAILYQLGNNPHHTFVYDAALKYPGVVVMHEANLHHLIADATIRRGDWDAYLKEVESTRAPIPWSMPRRTCALSNADRSTRSRCCGRSWTRHAR